MFFLFFFNDTATTEIYTLSLHDALPIFADIHGVAVRHLTVRLEQAVRRRRLFRRIAEDRIIERERSEEHTSELQSRLHLVCRLLLEKKKKKRNLQYRIII